MNYLLEYSTVQKCFHLNAYANGSMEHAIGSNHYQPISVISEETAMSNGLCDLEDRLIKKDPPFETVRDAILIHLLK